MSHNYYNEKFLEIYNDLSTTLTNEVSQTGGIEFRGENRKLFALLYIRYILMANKLIVCVDQMIQPQKRNLLKKLLEACLGRILELKADLVEADLNEWTHCGDIYEKLNLTPGHAELQVPLCFKEEMAEEIQYKKQFIENVLTKFGFVDKIEEKPAMTEQQAILIIQTHERARQSRIRAQYMKDLIQAKVRSKHTTVSKPEGEKLAQLSLAATLRIQKIWRGYMTRRATRRRKIEEMILIGMLPPHTKKQSDESKQDIENCLYRKQLQKEQELQYVTRVIKIKEQLQEKQKDIIIEQLTDQIRDSFRDYKNQTGRIPESIEKDDLTRNSSSKLFTSRQGTESEISKSPSDRTIKEIKPKKKKQSKSVSTVADNKNKEDEEENIKAIVSRFVPELNAKKEEYESIWLTNNETLNHQLDENIIEKEIMTKMGHDLRQIVNEMMKAELVILQEAYERDKGCKTKKKSSKKTKKASKKSKKKKEKDLTPDRTLQSLFEELVANGIIKKYPEIHLKDFLGEKSFYLAAPHNIGQEPPIDLGDVRQILTEYCVIPLLSEYLHQTTPHIKSVLLAGSKGSGKNMLVHAICNETGAVLFDLTPSNIVGKYPGKSGLIMLLHLVVKVSKLLQPAVIYMNQAERPFVKKIPKTDRTDPKRLKKDLPKIIKNFNPEDRVLFIGVTDSPWEADQKLLQQVYQKFLYIPRPNYSSRYTLWTSFLNQYLPIGSIFDTGIISKISDGYTAGAIKQTINEVVTVKRILQLKIRPLSPFELVNVLCKMTPVYKEEQDAFENWWSKVPIMRRRAQAKELLEEEQQTNNQTKKKK